jgi:GTP-binding protein
MSLVAAIVGRPNVGKSTLFNRLVGRRDALVSKTPGLTRDRREGQARLADLEFMVIDTAGLDEEVGDQLTAGMRTQTEQALESADIALFLIDTRAGITPLDRHFAKWLRKHRLPILLVANKYEGRGAEAGYLESFDLGLDEPMAISAEHGTGLMELYEGLRPFIEAKSLAPESPHEGTEDAGEEAEDAPLLLAVVGRPNVGKSTLANRLLGEERMLTGPEPGVTRDAIPIDWSYKSRQIRLVDTAGLRRRSRVSGQIEKLTARDTLRQIRRSEVTVLVIDGTEAFERQDLAIARAALEEGRALVIAINKWDLITDREDRLTLIAERLSISLPQARGVSCVPLSALSGWHINRLMPAVFAAHERWNRRIATGPLNRWLAEATARHPPPMVGGRRIRLRYVTQPTARPPTFAIFVSRPEQLPDSYMRYLENTLRDSFDLPGIPLRLRFRRGKNPYARD